MDQDSFFAPNRQDGLNSSQRLELIDLITRHPVRSDARVMRAVMKNDGNLNLGGLVLMLLGDIAIMPRKEDGPRLAEEAWSLAFSITRLRWCGLLTIAPYREDDLLLTLTNNATDLLAGSPG